MERMNGEFRDRDKIVKGLKKDNSPFDYRLSDLPQLYDRIWVWMARTPSEVCGIKVEGDNKWPTIIEKARREQ